MADAPSERDSRMWHGYTRNGAATVSDGLLVDRTAGGSNSESPGADELSDRRRAADVAGREV
jgi:hypothetical protein